MRFVAAILFILGLLVTLPTLAAGSSSQERAAVVKIGFIGPTNSPSVNAPDGLGAAQAFVAALNQRGGLKGRRVQLIYCNDKNDSNTAADCGRQIVQAGAIAVVGGQVLGSASLLPVLEAAKIPRIGGFAFSAADFTSPDSYLFGADFFGWQTAAAYAVKVLHQPKFSLVNLDVATANGWIPSIAEAIKNAGGTVTSNTKVPGGNADWAPIASSAAQGSPNGILGLLQAPVAVTLMLEMQREGIPWSVWIAGSMTSQGLAQLGPLGGKLLQYSPYPPFNARLPWVKEMVKELNESYLAGNFAANPRTVASPNVYPVFLGIKSIEYLSKGMKTVTGPNLKAALDKAKNIPLGGLIPPWTPSRKGPTGYERVSNNAFYLFTYKNGAPRLYTPKPVTLAAIIAGKVK